METYRYTAHNTTYEVTLEKAQYANGRTALILMGTDGQQVANATVNLPEHSLEPDEVLIKTWAENEPMLGFLVQNNIVRDTGREVPTGHVKARVCKLLI